MNLDRIIGIITEGRSPMEKAMAEVRGAKTILGALERDLKNISPDSSTGDKNRLRQHIDQAIFSLQKVYKAVDGA